MISNRRAAHAGCLGLVITDAFTQIVTQDDAFGSAAVSLRGAGYPAVGSHAHRFAGKTRANAGTFMANDPAPPPRGSHPV